MKLLEKFTSIDDAYELEGCLRSEGILTHLSSKNSHMLDSIKTGALHVGVWVVLENQWADAKALLENAEHVVKNPLSEEKMREIEATIVEEQSQSISKFFKKLAVWFLGGLLLLIIAYVIYGVSNEA